MKYAIISDIHGNLAAFKRVVVDAKKRKCNKIVCLGQDSAALRFSLCGGGGWRGGRKGRRAS